MSYNSKASDFVRYIRSEAQKLEKRSHSRVAREDISEYVPDDVDLHALKHSRALYDDVYDDLEFTRDSLDYVPSLLHDVPVGRVVSRLRGGVRRADFVQRNPFIGSVFGHAGRRSQYEEDPAAHKHASGGRGTGGVGGSGASASGSKRDSVGNETHYGGDGSRREGERERAVKNPDPFTLFDKMEKEHGKPAAPAAELAEWDDKATPSKPEGQGSPWSMATMFGNLAKPSL